MKLVAFLAASMCAASALAQPAVADAGSDLDSLPPEQPTAPAPAATPTAVPFVPTVDVPLTDLPRETAIENSLGRVKPISGSAFGGYGELTLNAPSNGPAIVDLRRVVLYFGHDFNEQFRFYSELEMEHALASSDLHGEIEVEQAYIDWLVTPKINLRFGLILMPMGIINVYHEPPSFFGVDRPDVDEYVIPSTWREPGFGIFGELSEGLRYQLYFVDGFDAAGFSAQYGLKTGSQEASFALAADVGAILRLDYEPILGTVFGATAYGGIAGAGAEATGALAIGVPEVTEGTLPSSVGSVPVGLFDLDARSRWKGWTARFEAAVALIGDTQALNQALLAEQGSGFAGPVSSVLWGGYAELGYDLLHVLAPSSSQEFDVYTRGDLVNTQAAVPAGFNAVASMHRRSLIGGIVYKPIPQIALKLDDRYQGAYQTASYNQIDAAITWLF